MKGNLSLIQALPAFLLEKDEFHDSFYFQKFLFLVHRAKPFAACPIQSIIRMSNHIHSTCRTSFVKTIKRQGVINVSSSSVHTIRL